MSICWTAPTAKPLGSQLALLEMVAPGRADRWRGRGSHGQLTSSKRAQGEAEYKLSPPHSVEKESGDKEDGERCISGTWANLSRVNTGQWSNADSVIAVRYQISQLPAAHTFPPTVRCDLLCHCGTRLLDRPPRLIHIKGACVASDGRRHNYFFPLLYHLQQSISTWASSVVKLHHPLR
jgi:hypothetical protein